MAVRDRNDFVIRAYAITATIISSIILVLMFLTWRAWSDTSKTLASTREQLTTAQQNGTAAADKVKRLISMMGNFGNNQFTQADLEQMQAKYKDDAELGPVEKEFARMQVLFPANTPLSERNLTRLPQLLLETIRLRNDEVAESRARVNALETQMAKEIQDHRRARETAEQAQQKAEKDLADARIAHKQQIETVNRIKDETVEKFNQNKAFFDNQLRELSTKVAKLETDGNEKSETIAKQIERIQRFENPDYATAQGRITMVTDGGTKAYINLGAQHGLRKGTTFSILDASDTQISKASPKARMIIQSVSEESATGEVYFGDDADSRTKYYRNPVVTGDQIYSPVWRPGRKVSFAMVGKMDINNDFQDDADQVRTMIEAAGGVVDAEMPAKGAEKGRITPSTVFLVVGTDVESIANTPNGADKAKEYSKFISKAKSNGLQEISVEKLIGYLKVDESSRIVPLGKKIQGSDFKVRNQVTPPQSSGSVSEIFTQGKKP